MKPLLYIPTALLLLAGTTPAEDLSVTAWDKSLAVGGSMTQGNSDTVQGNASFDASRETDTHLLRLRLQTAYGRSEVKEDGEATRKDTTVDNSQATIDFKRKLNGVYAYASASLHRDRIAKVEYRALAGLGGGYFVVANDTIQLSAEAGLGYLAEEVGSETDEYPVLRAAQRMDWVLGENARA